MPRGSAKGERRGGRKKGTPNKATLAREMEVVAQKHAAGQKIGKEMLSAAANYFFDKFERHQTKLDSAPEAERGALETTMEEALKTSANLAKDLAPYESPRLQSIAVTPAPFDISRLTDDQLEQLIAIQRAADPRNSADRTGATTH